MTGKAERIEPASISTQTFGWSAAKRFVTPDRNGAALTFGEVVIMPGGGHSRHNHADAEPFKVSAGDVIYLPAGVNHSTFNAGWEPLRVLALYNPGGSELGLATLPDFREVPAGQHQAWQRSN